MSDRSPVQWLQESVRIAYDGVYFGDEKIPGCIARGGITVLPGGGSKGINRMTIEFLVGEVLTEDPTNVRTEDPTKGNE